MTEPPAPAVSIIIVAWQAGRHLARCLEALDRQSFGDFEVILFDNASTDEAVDETRPRSWLRIERSRENLGFAVANNCAAGMTRGRYLVMLNPDAFAEPGWLAALVAAAERHPEAGSVGSIQLLDADPELSDGIGDAYHAFGVAWRGGRLKPLRPVCESETFGVCAAAALYRRAAFEAVGGFCERYFAYYEDVDIAMRLRLAGWTAIVTPDAVVRHVGSASAPSDFVLLHATRNRVWTYFRGMPGPLLALTLAPTVAIWAAGLLLDTIKGHGATRLKAFRGALGEMRETLTERRILMRERTVSLARFARALTWSATKFLTRGIDLRPIPDLAARVAQPPPNGATVIAVIVSYKPDETLDRVLEAALAQTDRVVLVDNGSGAEAQSRLAALAQKSDRLTLIANSDNRGLAAGQNQGIDQALALGADWVLLLDDDSVPGDGMVATMLAAWERLEGRARVGLITPRLTDAAETLKPRLVTARGRFGFSSTPLGPGMIARDGLFAIASGSLIRARVLQVSGRMDARFFIDYVDIEFCLRLRRAGFEIVGIGDAVLYHRLGEAQKARGFGRARNLGTHPAWRRRLKQRNRLRVWRRHGGVSFGWLAFDVAAAIHDVWKVLVHEDDKAAKLKAIGRGFAEGWRD